MIPRTIESWEPGLNSNDWKHRTKGSLCGMCGKKAVQGHHIIPQHILKREAKDRGYKLGKVKWDQRNYFPMCQQDHMNHHAYVEGSRIPRSYLPEEVFEFAEEYGLTVFLDMEYPPEETEEDN